MLNRPTEGQTEAEQTNRTEAAQTDRTDRSCTDRQDRQKLYRLTGQTDAVQTDRTQKLNRLTEAVHTDRLKLYRWTVTPLQLLLRYKKNAVKTGRHTQTAAYFSDNGNNGGDLLNISAYTNHSWK